MASYSGRHRSERNRCLNVLGVSPDASEDEIQQAYRRLALTHHPDKNKDDPEATRKFQEISNAYRILTKAEARDDTGDDESYSPFGMHSFYFTTTADDDDDDDDDDEPFLFFGHPLFAMFAQEIMFERMRREMYMRRFMFRRQQEEQEAERNRQRWRNRSDRDLPSWARSRRFDTAEDRDDTHHSPSHTQPNSSPAHHRHSERGNDTSDCKRDHGNLGRQDQDRQHTTSEGVATGSGSSSQTQKNTQSKNPRRRSRKGKHYRKAAKK